nr:hypothetical protein CFP56_04495 [Quercus suber]
MNFDQATTVHQKDSHTYTADFQDSWVIGTVPHGGYVTSVLQRAVKKHFDTTLAKQNQPHTLTLHLDFLRRTEVGNALITIKDVKLGRQTSVVHVTLSQGSREEVVGYITHSHLGREEGVSFDTHWDLHPSPLPTDISKLESDTEPNWKKRSFFPFPEFRKASSQCEYWSPRVGQASPATVDQWMRLRDPTENFTNESLGFVVDLFPQIIEAFLLQDLKPNASESERVDFLATHAKFWYPTLLLNLDVKKALPAEGAKYLFLRLQAKSIKNGRFDLEIVVKDATGDLVALSHHVCLAAREMDGQHHVGGVTFMQCSRAAQEAVMRSSIPLCRRALAHPRASPEHLVRRSDCCVGPEEREVRADEEKGVRHAVEENRSAVTWLTRN